MSENNQDFIDINVKKSANHLGFALFFFMICAELVLPVLIRMGFDAMGREIPTSPVARLVRGTLPMYLIAIPATWLLVRKLPKHIPHHRTPAPVWMLMLIPMVLFIMVAGGIVGSTLADIIGTITHTKVENVSVDAVERAPFLAQIIVAVIIGPFFEELLFRKILMDRLMPFSSRNAVLISALAFAFFHCSIHQFLYVFGIGLLLAGLYQNTGNILFPWLLHAVANLVSGILPMQLHGKAAHYYWTVYILICCLGLVLMVMHRNMLIPKDEPRDLPRRATSPAMFLNPGFLAYYVLCFFFTILIIFSK